MQLGLPLRLRPRQTVLVRVYQLFWLAGHKRPTVGRGDLEHAKLIHHSKKRDSNTSLNL